MSSRLSCKRLILFVDRLPPPFAHVKEQLYPPSWVQGPHVHEHTHCCYVTSGRARLTLPKEDRIVEAGDMVLIRSGVAHGWKGLPNQAVGLFDIGLRECASEGSDLLFCMHDLLGNRPFAVFKGYFGQLALLESIRAETRVVQEGSAHMVGAYVCQWVIQWMRAARKTIDRGNYRPSHAAVVDAARRYIESNYNQPISLAALSRMAHVSPHYFCELFTRWAGVPPMHYLARVRVQKARQLLRDFDLRIGEIAEAVGFADYHYFSRLFRKYTGRSPMAYRRSLARRGRQERNHIAQVVKSPRKIIGK